MVDLELKMNMFNLLFCAKPMWIGTLCSQWRLSPDPSYSYQSQVQHSCTIHRCITSLLLNFRLGQTKFFSAQHYFVDSFLLLYKCLKCSCSVLSILEKEVAFSLLELLRQEIQKHHFLLWYVLKQITCSAKLRQQAKHWRLGLNVLQCTWNIWGRIFWRLNLVC